MTTPATDLPSLTGAVPEGPTLAGLRTAYESGSATPSDVVRDTLEAIAERAGDNTWISLAPAESLLAAARDLERAADAAGGFDHLPLYGVPIGVKDNIDVTGLPTTNACPDYGYLPARSATAVRRLVAAGAIMIGKTNLDQFATGLVGARSPYGACRSVFGGDMISGGSSSGSAVAVASGVVPVAVATDTAGSGRVPAAMNGIVGFKPTLGLISTAGLVPACRSIDCITVMSRTAADAVTMLRVMGGPDPDHPWSRSDAAGTAGLPAPGALRLGLPTPGGLEFFGDTAMREAHLTARARAVATLRAGTVDVDLDPFVEAGSLLYGPWVAERYADLGEFIASHPDSVVPVVREIIMGGTRFSAPELFRAQHRLKELRHLTGKVWQDVDALVLPTVGTTFTVEEVLADPISRNTALGRYTQFANLLNLAAVSVPAGTTADGRPVALMVLGPARSDLLLAGIAATLLGETLLGETRPTGPSGETRPSGPSGETRPSGPSGEAPNEVPAPFRADVTIAVAGRHLSVGTRNRELLERGARLLETTTTSAEYRLYALPPADDPLPGLLPAGSGGPIEVELWSLPAERLADLLLQVPVPLYLGRLHLADGREVLGFLADGHAVRTAEESGEATDITATGGWRYYRSPAPTSSTHPEGRS